MNDDTPLGDAREWLHEHIDEGAKCPLCTQFAKVYRRKINAGVARALIALWDECGQGWANLHAVCGRYTNHTASAAWWGLLEESPERRDDGGRGKAWRLTDAGVNFVHHRLSVPKYARLYDGRVLGFDGENVTIVDALGDKFDYSALMRGE